MEDHFYDDILDHPYPFPTDRPRMSRLERAAQFSPFAALTGYEESIEEEARLTESLREMGEEEREALNAALRDLLAEEKDHPPVRVTWFRPDERKNGGAYVTSAAPLKRILTAEEKVLLQTGEEIPFSALRSLEKAEDPFSSSVT